MKLYMQNADFFMRKGLYKSTAQLLLHYYELMKLS